MKTLVILVLTLGIVVSVIANPVSKQTIQSENKISPEAESSDSQTKHREVINMSNKGDQEQKKDTLIENPDLPNIIDTSNGGDVGGKVEIIIEENIISPTDPLLPGDKCDHDDQEQTKHTPNETPEAPSIGNYKDVDQKVEIIIEEDIVNPNDNNPEMQVDLSGGSQLADHIGLSEGMPQLAETLGDSPQLPEFIGSVPQLPHFFENGHQFADLMGGLQFPGFVEESSQLPGLIEDIPQLPGFSEDGPQQPENSEDDFSIDKDYFREDMQKVDDEIMDTAAGFIPTPLVFRRKQKPRRRFATRRHFRRNPYRRHQLFYPYRYYAFYRPSSLRYY